MPSPHALSSLPRPIFNSWQQLFVRLREVPRSRRACTTDALQSSAGGAGALRRRLPAAPDPPPTHTHATHPADCLHFLSRQPQGFDTGLLASLVNQATVVMKLNPENRPLNHTLQAGCWA